MPEILVRSEQNHRGKMIKKSAILAKNKPIYFFAAGLFSIAFLSTLIGLKIFLVIKYTSLIPDGSSATPLVIMLYTPLVPFFLFFCLMLSEWYLNLFKVGWVLGLDKMPFLSMYLRWAGIEQKSSEDQ